MGVFCVTANFDGTLATATLIRRPPQGAPWPSGGNSSEGSAMVDDLYDDILATILDRRFEQLQALDGDPDPAELERLVLLAIAEDCLARAGRLPGGAAGARLPPLPPLATGSE
jgi:hypothetical protein